MAKNSVSEPEPEIEESIGTEEEDESSGEEGSEDETPQPKIRPVSSIPQKLPNPQSSSEEEDEDEDEEEEFDSDSYALVKKSDPGITSTADDLSKPTASSTRKPKSKTEIAVPTSPAKPGAKRPADKEVEIKETKKSKKILKEGENNSGVKGPPVINNDSKKQLFQRLWSEEDEIVILKGMLDYSAKKKADPVSDFGAFLEFIKKSLHIEVTKTQLQDKVRRLKKKFANNASKEKTGQERTFSKPHEQMAYELSKRIWGKLSINNGNVGNEKVQETPKASNVEVEDQVDVVVLKNGSFSSGLSYSSVAEWILNDGSKIIEREKREEMEEKWKKIQKEEVEVFLKRTEWMCEQTKLVLEAMRKSEH